MFRLVQRPLVLLRASLAKKGHPSRLSKRGSGFLGHQWNVTSVKAFSSSSEDPPAFDEDENLFLTEDVQQSAQHGQLDDTDLVKRVPHVPTYPNVVVVPIDNRPLFPGTMYPMTIHDEELALALESLVARNMPYCGVFLRTEPSEARGKDGEEEEEEERARGPEEEEAIMMENQNQLTGSAEVTGLKNRGEDVVWRKGWSAEEELGETVKEQPVGGEELFGMHRTKSLSDLYETGIFAQIQQLQRSSNGLVAFLMAHRRIAAVEVSQSHPVLMVKVKHIEEETRLSLSAQSKARKDAIKAYTLAIMATIKNILPWNPLFKEQLQYFVNNADLAKPWLLADLAAGLTSANGDELQEILETIDIKERLRKSLILLQKEFELSKLQVKVAKDTEESMNKKQRQYMLQEQLKSIKKELGLEKDDKAIAEKKFRERLEGKHVTQEVMEVIEEELNKLSFLESASQEYNVTRNYLDWLTCLPYGIYTEENFDIAHAEKVLKEDHYGLEDVKERILEFIAVGNLLGSSPQGKIICLVGPPGVGKTSIGKSIARALKREFFRFSVGGMGDVAEIKGHRRTYVGAMPGKLVQCLKKVQCSNPVILIDEIDKLGTGRQGDPASALLEVLDPEQNNGFNDHYLDVPLDLSKVLFICTANVQDTIPGPLADRMDFIRIAGYVWQEKMHIVRNFLEPVIAKKTGVSPKAITLTEDAVRTVVRYYCREAGVRNLQKHLEKIYRKVALRLVRKETDSVIVDEDNLADFLGKAPFPKDRMYETTPNGVVMGLAWNSMGGATLYIEAAVAEVTENSGSLTMTGMMGDVMRESAQIAYTVAKAQLLRLDADNTFFAHHRIHLHIPEGATPKDGPSAGITMITSLLSLAVKQPLPPNIAMTGEVTLTGKVLAVGGIKEKMIAARRSFVTKAILPAPNKKDFEELPDYIREGMEVMYASEYQDVFNVVFPSPPSSSSSCDTETAS